MTSFSTLRISQRVVENWLTNWGSLSVDTFEGIPFSMTQLFKNNVVFSWS